MASHVLYRFNSEQYFLLQLNDLRVSINSLAAVVEANSRVQAVGRPPQVVQHLHQWRNLPPKRSPALIWPFSWLAAGIDGLLTRLDKAVWTWLQTGCIARWLNRMRFWLMKRKRVNASAP